MRRAIAALGAAIAIGFVFASTPARADFASAAANLRPASPYARLALDETGMAIANAAISTKHPALVAIGYSYKAVDVAYDIGDAAVEKDNELRETQLIETDRDLAQLREMKHNHEDLNGHDAQVIKDRLHARIEQNGFDHADGSHYLLHTVIRNLPYAVAKVGVDKLFDEVVEGLTEGIGSLTAMIVPAPEFANWAFNRKGPLRNIQRRQGWRNLGTRAKWAEHAVREAMHEEEIKFAREELRKAFAIKPDDKIADYISELYRDCVFESPKPPEIRAIDFRTTAALSPVLYAAPAAAIVQGPVTAFVAAPAAAPVIMRAATPDPVIRASDLDVAFAERYSSPVDQEDRTVDVTDYSTPPQTEEPDPATAARDAARHEELMRVGDGVTFDVCSNGCPGSDSSWEGRPGQTLMSK